MCIRDRAAAAGFEPEANQVRLADGSAVSYQQLIVCPGLRLAWDKVDGLSETLGRNGVSSNYRFDLAPYTWELVRGLKGGKALFTQPAMPIKCAGAPQKAMYLACDHWRRSGVLDRIDVEFDLAGAVLFGVPTFVPPLMRYVESYGIGPVSYTHLQRQVGAAQAARPHAVHQRPIAAFGAEAFIDALHGNGGRFHRGRLL